MKSLIRYLPDFLVKFFARPYVAGDSLEQGLAVTRRLLQERGVLTTFDLLSENIVREEVTLEIRETYRRMIEACAEFSDAKMRPTVSLKPSSFTTQPLDKAPPGSDRPPAGSEEAIRELSDLAKERDVALTIDMEDRHWTEWTLDLARTQWQEGTRHVGIVLQTRMHRTEKDLEALPSGIRVRLVIGIYNEPSEHAIRDKKQMKQRMLDYAKWLLERGHFVEFATHDQACIRRFLEDVVPAAGAASDQFEIQMLYGVPMRKFQDDLMAGRIGNSGPVTVRLYVPFANSWKHALAYCRRRLMENPSMAGAVARNLGRALIGRR